MSDAIENVIFHGVRETAFSKSPPHSRAKRKSFSRFDDPTSYAHRAVHTIEQSPGRLQYFDSQRGGGEVPWMAKVQ